jgi:hypothetical protein
LPITNEKTVPGRQSLKNNFYPTDYMNEITITPVMAPAQPPQINPLPSMNRSKELNEAINPNRMA